MKNLIRNSENRIRNSDISESLAAAAPDLLWFAQKYVKCFEEYLVTNQTGAEFDIAGLLAERARSAIRKATEGLH